MTAVFNHRPAPVETAGTIPPEITTLLAPGSETSREAAWQAFVERYSRLVLGVAFAFAPGYDGAMDRYAYILDQLRRDEYRRLRHYSAGGRGCFSTWLTIVARRLCVDHYRERYGRSRQARGLAGAGIDRLARRRLVEMAGCTDHVDWIADALQTDPVDALGDAELRQALGRALSELAPQDRLLLRLRFEKDLTAGEIALFLSLPTPFHVYRRLRCLLRDLRARLRGHGVEA